MATKKGDDELSKLVADYIGNVEHAEYEVAKRGQTYRVLMSGEIICGEIESEEFAREFAVSSFALEFTRHVIAISDQVVEDFNNRSKANACDLIAGLSDWAKGYLQAKGLEIVPTPKGD